MKIPNSPSTFKSVANTLINIALIAMFFLLPTTKAQAVGIYGNVEILSALNEPLKLRFPIIVQGENWDENDIQLSVATRKEYSELELPFPKKIQKLKFTVGKKLNGRINVIATTKFIIREPVISLLIYVRWPKGKIRYEFTLLLDLPEENVKQADNVKRPSSIAPVTSNDSLLKATIIADAPLQQSPQRVNDTEIEITPIETQTTNNLPVTLKEEQTEPFITIKPFEIGDNESQQEIISEVVIDTTPQIVWNADYKKHIIRNGDSLSIVAMNYRGNAKIALHKYIAAIIEHNTSTFRQGLNDINVGDALSIPNPNLVGTLRKKTIKQKKVKQHQAFYPYTVQYGDILSLLAQRLRGKYKIGLNQYIAQIIKANSSVLNTKGNNLVSGMVLQIPNLYYQKSNNDKQVNNAVKRTFKKLTEVKKPETLKTTPEKIEKKEHLKTETETKTMAVNSPLVLPKNKQQQNPLLMSISALQAQSLITTLGKQQPQLKNHLVYKANVNFSMDRVNGAIVIGQTAVINSNGFNVKPSNNLANNSFVQTENSQQYKTIQVSYRYLQQQMEQQKRTYQENLNYLKLGFLLLLIVFVGLFIAFHFYMQKTMQIKFEKWLDASQVELKKEQEITQKHEEAEELEEALSTLFEDGSETETEIDTSTQFNMEPDSASATLKASLMAIVKNKFKKKERTPIIEKPLFSDISKEDNDFDHDETLFSHTDYADASNELNVDDVNLNYHEDGTSKDSEVEFDESEIANEFETTVKLDAPLVNEGSFDHLALADQPVQQPVLPDDMSLADDFEIGYTTDVDGELEKEKQRIIERLKEKTNSLPENDDLTRFSKPESPGSINEGDVTFTLESGDKELIDSPQENNDDEKNNVTALFEGEDVQAESQLLTSDINYLLDEIDEDVLKKIEETKDDELTAFWKDAEDKAKMPTKMEALGMDEQISYIKAEIEKEELQQKLKENPQLLDTSVWEPEQKNEQSTDDLLDFELDDNVLEAANDELDDELLYEEPGEELDEELDEEVYKNIKDHLVLVLNKDDSQLKEDLDDEEYEHLIENSQNAELLAEELKTDDEFEDLAFDESHAQDAEERRKKIEENLRKEREFRYWKSMNKPRF